MTERSKKGVGTKAHILVTATPMFAKRGYSGTALNDIAEKAGVTTGAIYYHFGDKKGLFRAVAEAVEQSILDEITRLVPVDELTWETFELGVVAALDVCARPTIQRIIFVDAPTVIGLRQWREIEMNYAFGMFKQMLAALSSTNELAVKDVDLASQILLGAIIEAAQAVADAPNKTKSLSNAKSMIVQMLQALRR